MEIEVGEYVRTKDKILKVDSFEKDDKNVDCVCFTTGEIYTLELLNEIMVKHSKNIINLIEVGDIVNNGYIYEIGNTEDGHKWVHNLNGLLLFEDDIKTILTKEQYTQNCYTVERKEE